MLAVNLDFMVKDARDPLSSCGIFSVSCLCREVYIGTTKCSVHTCIDEHSRYCHLGQLKKSAVAKHALTTADHRVLSEEIKILSLVSSYYPWLHLESFEMYKHGSIAMNQRGENLLLNRIWNAVRLNQSGSVVNQSGVVTNVKDLETLSESKLQISLNSILNLNCKPFSYT